MILFNFLTILFTTMLSSHSYGFTKTMQFKQLQGDASLDGIGCAFSEYESARGIEFDSSTETCGLLNKTWFVNRAFKAEHNYYELMNVNQTIEKKSYLQMPVPDNFRLGDSIVMFFEKETNVTGAVKVQVDLFDGDAVVGGFGAQDHIYIHINNKKNPGLLTFNSFLNGGWGTEETIADPFTNSTGKMEMFVITNFVVVFVNDVYVYSYGTPVKDHLILLSQDIHTFCNKIHFHYRN